MKWSWRFCWHSDVTLVLVVGSREKDEVGSSYFRCDRCGRVSFTSDRGPWERGPDDEE